MITSAREEEPKLTYLNGTFEWLTNFNSVFHLLDPKFLFPDYYGSSTSRSVLHIGCGSSTMGEQLLGAFPNDYTHCLNVDRDRDIIDFMKDRSQKQRKQRETRISMAAKTTTKPTTCPNCDCEHVENATNHLRSTSDVQDNNNNMNNKWLVLDFCNEEQSKQCLPSDSFDVILDKSTLDCALCSQDAVSSLLAESYRALRPNSGVLFLISFHSHRLIIPLLKHLFYEGNIEHYVVDRMVDDYFHEGSVKREQEETFPNTTDLAQEITCIPQQRRMKFCSSLCIENYREYGQQRCHSKVDQHNIDNASNSSPWATGRFHPTKKYCKTINVFVCRKSEHKSPINRDSIQNHVIQVCNDWYIVNNPLLTQLREDDLRRSFEEKLGVRGSSSLDGLYLPLKECYDILFSNAEKSVLPYEYFLEDWNAFLADKSFGDSREDGNALPCGKRQAIPITDGMTITVALQFLKAMQ